MPANPKMVIRESVVLVTSRTEENLPFIPNRIINALLWAILARAKMLYQIKICHFVFMANHLHMLLVVDNPEHLPAFIAQVKRESAYAVNRLLGRRKHKVWEDGYDDPKILTVRDVIRYIVYIYKNPAAARIVNSIDEYPGVSSWRLFLKGSFSRTFKRIRRSMIKPLVSHKMTEKGCQGYLRTLLKARGEKQVLRIEPNAWIEVFPELRSKDIDKINEMIILELRKAEDKLRKDGCVMGARVVAEQEINKSYLPKKHGRRTICIDHRAKQRKIFISCFKDLRTQAKGVIKRWRSGDYSPRLPHGFFAPGGYLQSNWLGMSQFSFT